MPWKKGQSGNPDGRPKQYKEFVAKCRGHTDLAVRALVNALKDSDRAVFAATALLDRGWGKPPQAQTGAGGEGLVVIHVVTGVPRPDG